MIKIGLARKFHYLVFPVYLRINDVADGYVSGGLFYSLITDACLVLVVDFNGYHIFSDIAGRVKGVTKATCFR